MALETETTWILVTPRPEVCYPVDIVFAMVKNIVTCVCSCEIGVFVDKMGCVEVLRASVKIWSTVFRGEVTV